MSAPVSPRRQQAEERREQILDAALRVFAEKGFAGASMRDIAREVGVTEGLLYHYFAGKDQLLHACFTERSWRAHIERILAESQHAPVGGVLRALLRDFLNTLREHAPLVRACANELPHNPEVASAHMARIEENQKLICDFLRARQAAGEIRSGVDLEAGAGLLMGCGHSLFLLLGNAPSEVWGPLVAKFVESSVDVVMNGMAARG